MPAMHKMFENT